jgi:hypothetical protein
MSSWHSVCASMRVNKKVSTFRRRRGEIKHEHDNYLIGNLNFIHFYIEIREDQNKKCFVVSKIYLFGC